MKKILLIASAALLLAAPVATAVELESISMGFHLNPALEAVDGQRAWGLSLSIGAGILVGASSHVEVTVFVDSAPSSLGASFTYTLDLSDPFTVGGGLNMFWAFETEETLVRAVFGSFGQASARAELFTDFIGEAGLSLPLITFIRQIRGWEILPLAELPAVHVAGEWRGIDRGGFQGRMTLQPVIVDTTQFDNPIGRVSDELLILPTYSGFLRHLP